jgi:hypothetical protein
MHGVTDGMAAAIYALVMANKTKEQALRSHGRRA